MQSRIKALDGVEVVEMTAKELKRSFIPEPRRSSRIVAEFDAAGAAYGDRQILKDVSFVIERGRKVALVGPNGAGKTTLLRLLLGELSVTEGKARLGNKVDYARFTQNLTEMLDPHKTVLQQFQASLGDSGDRNPRTVLAVLPAVFRWIKRLETYQAVRQRDWPWQQQWPTLSTF